MKKEISTPAVAAIIVVICLVIGIIGWRAINPPKVIVPGGVHVTPPNFRTQGQTPEGGIHLTPPNFSNGGR